MSIGYKIKNIRNLKKLTQKELSLLANISEISIRKYESGVRAPKYETLIKIAKALEIPITDLLDIREEVKKIGLLNELLNHCGYFVEFDPIDDEGEHSEINIKSKDINITLSENEYDSLFENVKKFINFELYKFK